MEHPLKIYRVANKIKSKDLAKAVGVSPSMISRIEHGDAVPSFHLLQRLCRETGLEADEFLSFETV